MNKKLIAVAVASALGAPGVALAQASTVQIYGTMVMNYHPVVDSGGNAGTNAASTSKVKTDILNSHDSGLGFKGEESLGGGLTGWWQCESTIDITGKSSLAASAAWCGRNSAFGMKGGWGNAYVGIWDTPMKIISGNFRPFSTAGLYGVTMLWNGTESNAGNSATSFTRRHNSLISYATPVMSGMQLYTAFSAANEATASTSASTATKPRLYSFGGTYTNGPLMLGAGYETHKNFSPAAAATYTGGSDQGWTLGGAYTFAVGGGLKASVIIANNKYEINQTATGAGTVDQRAFGIYGDWLIAGPHRITMGYTKAGDTSGTAGSAGTPINVANMVANGGTGNTSMSLIGVRYTYHFSKRTELNFGYAKVTNASAASIPLQTLGVRNTGQDQNAFAIGTKHTF